MLTPSCSAIHSTARVPGDREHEIQKNASTGSHLIGYATRCHGYSGDLNNRLIFTKILHLSLMVIIQVYSKLLILCPRRYQQHITHNVHPLFILKVVLHQRLPVLRPLVDRHAMKIPLLARQRGVSCTINIDTLGLQQSTLSSQQSGSLYKKISVQWTEGLSCSRIAMRPRGVGPRTERCYAQLICTLAAKDQANLLPSYVSWHCDAP